MVSDFHIPELLSGMLNKGRLHRQKGSWALRSNADYYGHFLETELGEVHSTAESLLKATLSLPVNFPPDYAEGPDEFAGEPGHIPYICDFSSLVEFGTSGDGAPFCLDYRENPQEPSVIWWDDAYWRRLAPTFADFITLFDLSDRAN